LNNNRYPRLNNRYPVAPIPRAYPYQIQPYPVAAYGAYPVRRPNGYPFPIPMVGKNIGNQNPKFKTRSLNTNGKNYNYPIINNYYSKDNYAGSGGSKSSNSTTKTKVKTNKMVKKRTPKVIASTKACKESYDMNKIYKSDFPVTYRIKKIKGCN
jgi:hypothetical protein